MWNASPCWTATSTRKEMPMKMRNPFPAAKSISPFVPSVGDRVALVEPVMEHGGVVISPGRQGAVVTRTCGVFEVQFDHEQHRTRHVFQEQLAVVGKMVRENLWLFTKPATLTPEEA